MKTILYHIALKNKMKDFLRKIKLIDQLSTTLPLSRQEFTDKLLAITDLGGTGSFSTPFEAFSSSKNEFKGEVTTEGFKLKRRRKLFDAHFVSAIATGTIRDERGQLVIETEINGFRKVMLVFYIFLALVYSLFIVGLSFDDHNTTFPVIPFMLLHAAFMTSIPYFVMRRSVKRLKYELERELFYLTKQEAGTGK